jgi:PAT family beta-lactamase induction signal transducer AmpG
MNEIEAVGAEALVTPIEAPTGTPVGPPAVAGPERPWLFALLIAPSAVVANGVIQGGVLAYLLRQQGVGIGHISAIISLVSLPTVLYFLWSPITDFLVQRKTWVLIGAMAAGVMMAAAFHQPSLASDRAVWLIFFSACCSQLVISSCGGMMGTLRTERARRVASSFYQCGSTAFGAASVFVLVKVSDRGPHALLVALAAGLVAVPGLFALGAPRQPVEGGDGFGGAMRKLGREFKATFWRWAAIPYTLLLLFPMNSGAAVGLLPGIARDYHVSGSQVAWMNGVGGALLMAAGALAATLIPAKTRAAVVYLVVGIVNAATLAVLWLGPTQPAVYFAGVTLYLFTIGTGLSTFTAVVLEFLGDSGKSGSGRYSIINSLGNIPVLYMIRLDGWGGEHWGARWLPGMECVVSIVGAGILLAYFLTRRPASVEAAA